MARSVKIGRLCFGRWDTLSLHSDDSARQRVLVVSNCPTFRKDFIRIVRRENDFVVCGEVESTRTVQAAVAQLNPHIAVLHFASETLQSLALVNFLRTKFPALRILVISDLDDEACAERVLRLGGNGYLPRSQMQHECVHALRVVARMDAYTTPAITARMLKRAYQAGAAPSKPHPRLSSRELKILDLLGAGLDRNAIASKLHLSRHAVEAHCISIRRKLRLRTNEALRAYAAGR